FARRGHSAPFLRYDSTTTVFWPGCSLAGTSPEATLAGQELLAFALGEEVGLVLDCCFDPLFQMGDTGPVNEACDNIRERLARAGIREVIVGCINCKKVFERHMEDVSVRHFVEVLSVDSLASLPGEDLYLHHPCPAYHVEGIAEKISSIIGHPAVDDVDEQMIPACCGYGGSINNQDPELSEKFTERVTMAAYGASIVTSCMGCKNRFLGRGTNTYHLLELLTGVKPKEKPVGTARKWANRLLLAKNK
ncbi:MAG: heterodisulfide reductase-related iron-sulfur binding cluster, partial [Pseudomonadota bacterium]